MSREIWYQSVWIFIRMLWHHSGHAEETTLRPASPRPPPSGANAGQECKKEALSKRGHKTDHNSHREGNNGRQIGIGFAFARAGAKKLPPKKDSVLGPITRRGGLRMTIKKAGVSREFPDSSISGTSRVGVLRLGRTPSLRMTLSFFSGRSKTRVSRPGSRPGRRRSSSNWR